jgi:endonuclease/exonuclease/phosphatase family metal-dependent hydrolase
MGRILPVCAAASLLLAACGSESPATSSTGSALSADAASTSSEAPRGRSHGPRLAVMTRNIYLGADILAIAQAPTPEAVVAATTEFWAKVQMTDFPARAKVLAEEIEEARPDVIGLQEVTLYRSGPPLVCAGYASPDSPSADHVELDFLAILQRELHRRGLDYELAARVTTTDVELCAVGPAGVLDLRYTDHDLILVRDELRWRNPALPVPTSTTPGDSNGARFAEGSTAYFDIAGAKIFSWRGWTATEVRVGHEWVRVFETHLEDWLPVPPPYPEWIFQAGQAAELVSILDGSLAMAPSPTVLLGDFNVYATLAVKPPVYQFLVGGDFPLDPGLDGISPVRDAWTALRPKDPGFTWGFDELLRTGTFSTRLDLVLATPDLHPESTHLVGLHDRTRGGLHPSDHAGIVTTFSVR